MADSVHTPDIFIYSDPKKNKVTRKVGTRKGRTMKYKATEQDKARKESFSKKA
jgi:hypothetical protein